MGIKNLKVIAMLLFVGIVALAAIPNSLAQEKSKLKQIAKPIVVKPLQLIADLEVSTAYLLNCFCQTKLEKADVWIGSYLDGKIHNKRGITVKGKVTFKFYDWKLHDWRTLSAYTEPIKAGGYYNVRIDIRAHNYLIKKSSRIKVTVVLFDVTNVIDPDLTNNKKYINVCSPLVL